MNVAIIVKSVPGTAACSWFRAFPSPLGWLLLAVLLGLGLRGYHYGREPALWHDEAYQLLNIINHGYGQALKTQDNYQAAPPLFFWGVKALSQVLGDGLYAVRLLPFLASCLGLPLFAWLAWRLLPHAAAAWAVACFALSDRLLWHACEVKPYASDVLCAVGVLAVWAATASWRLAPRLLLLAALAPIVIWTSFPGCFLYGGVLVGMLPTVWQQRDRRGWLAYALLMLTVLVAFALLLGPIRAQQHPEVNAWWQAYFPPLQEPARVPLWLLDSTLNLGAYHLKPIGAVLMLFLVVGAWQWRRSASPAHEALPILLVPIVLPLAASFVEKYPFGGARVLAYTAPAIYLLAALGIAVTIGWLRQRHSLLATALVLALVLPPLGRAVYKIATPWPRADIASAATYIAAHWQPDDRLISNATPARYYFRDRADRVLPLTERNLHGDPEARTWLMITGETTIDRQRLSQDLHSGGRVVAAQRRFEQTDVYLLPARGAPPSK